MYGTHTTGLKMTPSGAQQISTHLPTGRTIGRTTPEHLLTTLDKRPYALQQFYYWNASGTEEHWVLLLRKDAQYQLGENVDGQ